MSDEFDDLLWDSDGNEVEGVALSPTKPSQDTLDEVKARGGGITISNEEVVVGPVDGAFPALPAMEKMGIRRASTLLDPDYDHDEGDFEPGLYKGFEILPPDEWPSVKAHAHIQRRFYVRHNDTVGMVPWAGSQIVWPWESAWEQTLHRDTVTSFLKEEKKETKKRG